MYHVRAFHTETSCGAFYLGVPPPVPPSLQRDPSTYWGILQLQLFLLGEKAEAIP